MNSSIPAGLYLILDHDATMGRSLIGLAEAAISGGVRTIQYRAKNLCLRESYRHLSQLKAYTDQKGVVLIVNDSVDLALAVGANGVHLGQEDLPLTHARAILGPNRLIGVSTHTLSLAKEAEAGSADYVGIGPIFPSATKQVRASIGCESLRHWRGKLSLPMVAIGGINDSNVRQVMETGVEAVAVVSAILSREDIAKATSEFLEIMSPGRTPVHESL